MIKCSQCKQLQDDANFRPLRGTRAKSRGRQKICRNCERFNNAFRRLQNKYDEDPDSLSTEQYDARAEYLKWYEMIIERDGGAFKARIPNAARKALGYALKDTTGTPAVNAITIEDAIHMAELQVKAARAEASSTIEVAPGTVPPISLPITHITEVSTESSMDKLEKAKKILVGIDVSELVPGTIKNIVYSILELINSCKNCDLDSIMNIRDDLENHAEALEDSGDLIIEEYEAAGMLDEAIGALDGAFNTDNRDEMKRLSDTLEYLQAVLFEVS